MLKNGAQRGIYYGVRSVRKSILLREAEIITEDLKDNNGFQSFTMVHLHARSEL